MSEQSVGDLKARVLRESGKVSRQVFLRFGEKWTVTRSDGTLEYRSRMDPSKLATKLDCLPYYNPVVISVLQYHSMIFLLKKTDSNDRRHSSQSLSKDKGSPPKGKRLKKRITEGPSAAGRAFEMTYHFPNPLAQFPRCVSMIVCGMNKIRPHMVDLEFQFFLRDFDDACGPLVTARGTFAPFRGSKKKSLLKDERIHEQKSEREVIQEVTQFRRADPLLCGVDSMEQVMIGEIRAVYDGLSLFEAEWCVNIWNGFLRHPYLIASADHLGYLHLIHLSMQFITQLFRRADSLLSTALLSRLDLHSWKNSPLFLRSLHSEFLKMVRIGQGTMRVTRLSVKNAGECALTTQVLQNGIVCYTVDVLVSPVFRFAHKL